MPAFLLALLEKCRSVNGRLFMALLDMDGGFFALGFISAWHGADSTPDWGSFFLYFCLPVEDGLSAQEWANDTDFLGYFLDDELLRLECTAGVFSGIGIELSILLLLIWTVDEPDAILGFLHFLLPGEFREPIHLVYFWGIMTRYSRSY